jgi:hypothetical protein
LKHQIEKKKRGVRENKKFASAARPRRIGKENDMTQRQWCRLLQCFHFRIHGRFNGKRIFVFRILVKKKACLALAYH